MSHGCEGISFKCFFEAEILWVEIRILHWFMVWWSWKDWVGCWLDPEVIVIIWISQAFDLQWQMSGKVPFQDFRISVNLTCCWYCGYWRDCTHISVLYRAVLLLQRPNNSWIWFHLILSGRQLKLVGVLQNGFVYIH